MLVNRFLYLRNNMKQLYIAVMFVGGIVAARPKADIIVRNRSSRPIEIALASDYIYYQLADYGYYDATYPSAYLVTPWLTDWVVVEPGKTYTFGARAYWVCPEYLVLHDICKLKGERVTQFETYDAVALVDDPTSAGQEGRHVCGGVATVTFTDRAKNLVFSGIKTSCEMDATVTNTLRVE